MSYLRFLKSYRSFSVVRKRSVKILQRYGLSGGQLRQNIRHFITDLNRLDVVPTFPTTAQVLNRHHPFFEEFDADQVEFAIHGYYHQDYTLIANPAKKELLDRAIATFQKYGIPAEGFRFPYLRVDDDSFSTLAQLPLKYDSSYAFWWNLSGHTRGGENAILRKMVRQYHPFFPDERPLIPYFRETLVEIPVSLPDDDILIDRMTHNDDTKILGTWLHILEQARSRGDIFVLQLHPERYGMLRNTLMRLLKDVQAGYPDVWIAPLREVARWWQMRQQFTVTFKENDAQKIKLEIKRPLDLNYSFLNLNYQPQVKIMGLIKSRFTFEEITLKDHPVPIVAMGRRTSSRFREMFLNYGFPVLEDAPGPDGFSVYFDEDPPNFFSRKWLSDFLAGLNQPLIRFHLWPKNYQAALSITGDIDAITAQDFLSRIYEK